MTRLSARGLASVIVLTLSLLAACSEADSGSNTAEDPYSVTVTTPDDGEQTLTDEPRRVAATNGSRVIPFLEPFLDDDHVLVGYGGSPEPAEFPWIQEQLETLPNSPDVDGPELEVYASWTPDLLLANGNLGDYWEPVRKVGPLVQLPETDWRATTELLGQIFEKPDVAEAVVAEGEELIAEARREEPVTAAVLSPYQDNGTVGTQVIGAELPNFLRELNIEVADSPTAQDGYEDVSLELLEDLLADVDHVIVLDNGGDFQQDFLEDPLVKDLPAFKEGRFTAFDRVQSGAAFPVTPPTIPVVIDAVTPMLEQ